MKEKNHLYLLRFFMLVSAPKIFILFGLLSWGVLFLLLAPPTLARVTIPSVARQVETLAQGTGRLYGYASASSVPQGGTITFHVSTEPGGVTTFDIQIFRVGATGLGTPVMTISNLPVATYSCGTVGVPAGQENTPLGCNWPVAYTLQVPANWPSGAYMAQLLDADDRPTRYGAYISFIVTEDQPGSTADILFHFPTFTWQAYNNYGGWGLYTDPPARLVTFDRPYYDSWWQCDPLTGCPYLWEVGLARWLDLEGYSVDYVASEDIHANPMLLFNYKLLITAGHDEYWSKEMRDNIDAFIEAGGNVAILSGNTAYRQVRYLPEKDRTLICYKGDWSLDPLYGVDNIRVATEFAREPVPSWPENSTIGVGFRNGGYVGITNYPAQYTVYRSNHWIYEGTGLQDGDKFVYETQKRVEVDGALFTWQNGLPQVTGTDESPLSFTILGLQQATAGYATLGLYTHSVGGGTVFNAATMGWGRGLWSEHNPQDYQIVRQITRNVIDQLSSGDPIPPPTYPISDTWFTYLPGQPVENQTVTFTAGITPAYASLPVTYTWQFGDGSPVVAGSSNIVSHSYADANEYTVTMTATNATGHATYSRAIEVKGMLYPVQRVWFTYLPGQPVEGQPVTFTAGITPTYASLPVTYTWQFEPGVLTSTTSPVISNTYATAGLYTVVVTATNPTAQSVYSSQAIHVTAGSGQDKTLIYLPIVIKN